MKVPISNGTKNPSFFLSQAQAAERRIRSLIHETPLEYSPYLSDLCQTKVFLKLENQQISGSFKYRGVANFMTTQEETGSKSEWVTASTGNHAAAFAHYLFERNRSGLIFLPEQTMPSKVEALHHLGVETQFLGQDITETERHARLFASETRKTYVPPYNHPWIIAGHATMGIELERQCPDVGAVFLPIGGGGLAAGVAGYLKSKGQVKVIGCQPIRSAVMAHSIRAGRIVSMKVQDTLADGCAGGIEADSITFEHCQKWVDEYCLLEEKEIIDALVFMLTKHHLLVEGAAALSVAALMKHHYRFRNQTVVLLITGKRIGLSRLQVFLDQR